MEQGCPHRSILPHIFPDCNSFAIKIGGKFCGVRGACPGGAACPGVAGAAGVSGTWRGVVPALSPACPATVVPAGGVPALSPAYPATVVPAGGVPALSPAYPATVVPAGGLPALPPACPATAVPAGGGVPALPPVNPALTCFPAPIPPTPLPGGKGETIGYFLQGASPLASPGLNPRGTGSPCRCGKLNGGLPRRCRRGGRQRYPAGGRARFVACLHCHCSTRFVAC